MKTYDTQPIADFFAEQQNKLQELLLDMEPYVCPYCDYVLLPGEDEDTGDNGCPCCRRIIDWEEDEYPRYPK